MNGAFADETVVCSWQLSENDSRFQTPPTSTTTDTPTTTPKLEQPEIVTDAKADDAFEQWNLALKGPPPPPEPPKEPSLAASLRAVKTRTIKKNTTTTTSTIDPSKKKAQLLAEKQKKDEEKKNTNSSSMFKNLFSTKATKQKRDEVKRQDASKLRQQAMVDRWRARKEGRMNKGAE